ncbi:hypothetical protein K438DRAFT_1785480 [Mycena galopus ATCC 62051]|nr:hypothetical protein K438DRAFT_1785480 [Mycena galopus ATCC 62051]
MPSSRNISFTEKAAGSHPKLRTWMHTHPFPGPVKTSQVLVGVGDMEKVDKTVARSRAVHQHFPSRTNCPEGLAVGRASAINYVKNTDSDFVGQDIDRCTINQPPPHRADRAQGFTIGRLRREHEVENVDQEPDGQSINGGGGNHDRDAVKAVRGRDSVALW